MKILVVDNDLIAVKNLKFNLEKDDNEVISVQSGKEALNIASLEDVDIIIQELILQDMDGLELCQKLREKKDTPIIILTTKTEDMNKILGLEYGADDYVTKPYNVLELRARIKAILRRSKMGFQGGSEQTIAVDDLVINTLGRKVTVNNCDVTLTAKEFDLLLLLATNPGKIFSREDLLGVIWGYEYFGDIKTLRNVDVHIRRLREKIERSTENYQYILTKWGLGYYFKSCVCK